MRIEKTKKVGIEQKNPNKDEDENKNKDGDEESGE